ncbi:MAG: hypothetical protein WA210_00545, partial [Burkholderiaceae bacterium]
MRTTASHSTTSALSALFGPVAADAAPGKALLDANGLSFAEQLARRSTAAHSHAVAPVDPTNSLTAAAPLPGEMRATQPGGIRLDAASPSLGGGNTESADSAAWPDLPALVLPGAASAAQAAHGQGPA